MTCLFVDLETFSANPISDGLAAYVRGVEVMLFAYAIDDGPVYVWDRTADMQMPHALGQALASPDTAVIAHNYQFERTVLRAVGFPVNDWRWHCTMAQALAHGLPGGLEKLSAVFKLGEGEAKLTDGRRLVQLFCKPRPKSMKVRRATRETHPQDWAKFVEYCASDVEAMRVLHRKMPTWNLSAIERRLFELDCTINERGVPVDVEFARAAVDAIAREQKRLGERTVEITEDELDSTRRVTAFREYLVEHYDIDLPNMRAGTVEKTLLSADLPEEVRELLLIRSQVSLTSSKKYDVVVRAAGHDRRLRGTLQYCGAARTGRWAGRLFQPQNLPRPYYMGLKKAALQRAIDQGIQAICWGVEAELFDDVMSLASSAVRGVIRAPAGSKLVVADLANIEGRVLAWLAGERWKVEAFKAYDAGTGPDLYRLAYSRSFGVPIDAVDDAGRFIGKVQELALGYQGAAGAFGSMAALYGAVLPEDEILRIVQAWRRANSAIVSFWYEVQRAAIAATLNRGEVFTVGRLQFDRVGAWLRIRLPSGRYLCYPSPLVNDGKLSFMGVNPYTKVFQRLKTYGGKLVENCTQAVARDVLAHAMPRVEAAGYAIVLTVHDEVLTEVPDGGPHTAPGLCELLTAGESWTDGLPLAAAGFETIRYRKD
jgi:DNA polymerase